MPPSSYIPALVEPLTEDHLIQSWFMGYLAPIERLPVELLCEIFAWYCLPLDPADFRVEPNDRPVVVSSVCRRWRDAAISYGKLWANIDVVTDTDGFIPWFPLIEMQLSRSKTAPLAISVTQAFPKRSSFSTVTPILSFLRPHLARAKSFRLSFQAISSMAPYELPTFADQTSCPLLRSVALLTNNLSHRDMTWLCALLFPAPQLSEVFWGSRHCLDQVNWDHLRSLDLDPGSFYLPPQWLNILCRGKELRHLQLHSLSGREFESYVMTVLPNLESLTVRYDQPHGHTLNWFILPKLQTLAFHAAIDFREISWSQSNFHAFLSRSGCTLTELILSDMRFPDRQLGECLALLPSLSKLRIFCTSTPIDMRATIKLLTPPISTVGKSPRKCLCPNLTALTLWRCRLGEDGLFGKMVARRRTIHSRGDGGIAQLQYVDVQFFGWLLNYEVRNFRHLVDCEVQGMNIIVRPPAWSHPDNDIVPLRTQFSNVAR